MTQNQAESLRSNLNLSFTNISHNTDTLDDVAEKVEYPEGGLSGWSTVFGAQVPILCKLVSSGSHILLIASWFNSVASGISTILNNV